MSIDTQATPGPAQGVRDACHDMRQPVAAILALAAATLAEPDLPVAARARLDQIVGQAEWLADLIHHSLYDTGPGEVERCQADLLDVASEAIAVECMTWTGEAKIVSPDEPVYTRVHPVLLRRMIANLLSNAIRAAGASGTVTVRASRERDYAVLAVEDNGPGFGKIDSGLGLGLAAVSRNAIKNGGMLTYGSGASGGARVCLWLPLSQAITGASRRPER